MRLRFKPVTKRRLLSSWTILGDKELKVSHPCCRSPLRYRYSVMRAATWIRHWTTSDQFPKRVWWWAIVSNQVFLSSGVAEYELARLCCRSISSSGSWACWRICKVALSTVCALFVKSRTSPGKTATNKLLYDYITSRWRYKFLTYQ